MNILVYRPAGGLGDMICGLPALAGLRAKYPGARIVFLGLDSYNGLVMRTGNVDEFLRLRRGPRPPSMDLGGLRLLLRRNRIKDVYDLVVNLWCPAGQHEVETGGRVTLSRIESFCAAAGVPPSTPVIPLTPEDLAQADATIRAIQLRRPLVIVQTHSANLAKDWPQENWRTLATGLRMSRMSVLAPRLDGSELPGAVNVLGLGVLQLAALCARADLVIALDSGLMHVAGGVGAPCVALFGPTDPVTTLRFYPQARGIIHPEVAAQVGCFCPCYYGMTGPGYRANGHCQAEGDCMKAIRPSEVLAAALEVLAGAKEGRFPAQGASQARTAADAGQLADYRVTSAQEAPE